jgi:hypothetical protein
MLRRRENLPVDIKECVKEINELGCKIAGVTTDASELRKLDLQQKIVYNRKTVLYLQQDRESYRERMAVLVNEGPRTVQKQVSFDRLQAVIEKITQDIQELIRARAELQVELDSLS